MRLARVRGNGGVPVRACEHEGELRRLRTAAGGIAAPLEGGETFEMADDDAPLTGERLAPVAPGKVVAIGLNYLDHIRETGSEPPARPLVFAKFPSSVIGPGAAIEIPLTVTERVDWEVELDCEIAGIGTLRNPVVAV